MFFSIHVYNRFIIDYNRETTKLGYQYKCYLKLVVWHSIMIKCYLWCFCSYFTFLIIFLIIFRSHPLFAVTLHHISHFTFTFHIHITSHHIHIHITSHSHSHHITFTLFTLFIFIWLSWPWHCLPYLISQPATAMKICSWLKQLVRVCSFYIIFYINLIYYILHKFDY